MERLCVFQVKVVSEFLKAGILLSKINNLCGLLEMGGYSLSHSIHLHQFILSEALDSHRELLLGKSISI